MDKRIRTKHCLPTKIYWQESHAANTMCNRQVSKENQDGHVRIIPLVVIQTDTMFNMIRSIARLWP